MDRYWEYLDSNFFSLQLVLNAWCWCSSEKPHYGLFSTKIQSFVHLHFQLIFESISIPWPENLHGRKELFLFSVLHNNCGFFSVPSLSKDFNYHPYSLILLLIWFDTFKITHEKNLLTKKKKLNTHLDVDKHSMVGLM